MYAFLIAICFVFVSSVSLASEDVSKFFEGVVESFNNQDCQSYSSFFKSDIRQKKRRESGIFFASNNARMQINETHLLSVDDSDIEVAVSYSIDNEEYVSRVFLEKENNEWKISKEVMVTRPKDNNAQAYQVETESTEYTSNPFANQKLPSRDAPPQQNCANGRCGGPVVPFSSLEACREYGFENIPCRKGSCSIK